MAIEAGQQLLHYRLVEQIGEGGMGIVWKAVDNDLGRELLFRGDFVQAGDRLQWSYDPTTDELIMIRNGEHEISRDRFVVVLDWPAELARFPR
jgi:serine/threonine protein kinase